MTTKIGDKKSRTTSLQEQNLLQKGSSNSLASKSQGCTLWKTGVDGAPSDGAPPSKESAVIQQSG